MPDVPAAAPVGLPRAWCARHYGPFAAHPALLKAVSEPLLEEFMCLERVMDFCGLRLNDLRRTTKAHPLRLGAAIEAFSPICCTLGDIVMARLYTEVASSRRPELLPEPALTVATPITAFEGHALGCDRCRTGQRSGDLCAKGRALFGLPPAGEDTARGSSSVPGLVIKTQVRP